MKSASIVFSGPCVSSDWHQDGSLICNLHSKHVKNIVEC
jgi:hypothetical protein